MHALAFRGADQALEPELAQGEARDEEVAAVGRRPRAQLREALYRHAVAPGQLDRARAARAAELVAAAIGGGAPLPAAVRRRLEAIVEADLGGVRVHTGAAADAAARAVGARAFAHGDDLVFADGAYAPGTPDGDRLLAHEAAHAAHHRGGATPDGAVAADAAAEAEADAAARAYAAAGRAPDPAHREAVLGLLRSIGVAIDGEDVDRLARQYGQALGLTRWSLGADRQDAAQRLVALVEHARGHQCPAGCAHPPRVTPLDEATRATVARATGVHVDDVVVERDATLGATRLGEVEGDVIRLAPAASGDDALGREVRLHEAIHVAQREVAGPSAPTAAVEAEAHAAAAAAARGEAAPLGARADAATPYGFDLGDVASALHIDPMGFVRSHFPQVAQFFDGGFGPIIQRLGDLAGTAVQGVLGRFGVGDLQQGFASLTGAFRPGSLSFGVLTGCCECLDHALHDLLQSVQQALNSDTAQTIRGWIAQAQEVENNRIIDEIADFFTALRVVGGPILGAIQTVGDLINQADQAIGNSAVWKALAPLVGLDGNLPPIEAIKKKLSELWEDVKAGLEAIKTGIAALWAKIKQNSVVAAVIKFVGDCGKLVAAIQKVRQARSRDPQVWLGILAKELQGTVFEGLVSSLQSGYSSVLSLKDAAVSWIMGILEETGLLSVWNAAVPYLNAIGRAIQGLARTIQQTVQAIKTAISEALDAAGKALQDLWNQIEPYISFVVGLGVAIAMTAGGDIFAIPRFVMGQLWLHVLPHCYKEALTNFLLDLFIMLVDWFPARHPIMILMRSAALSFLRTIRGAPAEQKIGAMDTIAKVMSNDVEVLAGFFVGVVEGLWNSSLGFIVQMAIFPLQMAWDILSTIGSKVAALGGAAFGAVFDGASWIVDMMANARQVPPGGAPAQAGAPGAAPAQPGAPGPDGGGASQPPQQPQVVTPVEVEPASPTSGTEDTPDDETSSGAAPTTPPPAPAGAAPDPSAQPAAGPDQPGAAPDGAQPAAPPGGGATPAPAPGAGHGGADATFEDPPVFPSLPPMGDLLDHVFNRGVSREEIEAMFQRLGMAMDSWGTRLGAEGANRLLPYLNARSAPYDLGKIIGEVVGWLAGEIIMLVFTEGIENAIAKVMEGAMDGARILAKIGEYFPKLVEWLMEMRKMIEPLIEAVEKIAAKAKEFLQKVMKWLEDMVAWFRRQWERLLKWVEETFGELGKMLRKAFNWAVKEEGEIEAEAEALEAANYAFEKLDVQLVSEAVPLTVMEEKLHAMGVPHTADVQMRLHLVTTTHWRIEATATKGTHRGVGLSVGRGAVLFADETMIPYYTASGHAARHEFLLDAAAQQLYREASALGTVEGSAADPGAVYRQVEELARATQEEYQAMLPVRNTNFRIKLEPSTSHHVHDEGYSRTEFLITPNAKKKWKDIPIGGGMKGFLGCVPTGNGRQFRGNFGPVPEPHQHTTWSWDDGEAYPSGPVTRHPANEHLGYQNHDNLSAIRPKPVPFTFVGGGTEGALDGEKAIWLAMLDGKLLRLRQQLLRDKPNPTPADEADAQQEAERRLLAWYQKSYPDIRTMSDLRLQGDGGRRWQAHHVHEHSWGGHNAPYNYQYLPLPDQHARFTAWWSRRQARIEQALFGYQR